ALRRQSYEPACLEPLETKAPNRRLDGNLPKRRYADVHGAGSSNRRSSRLRQLGAVGQVPKEDVRIQEQVHRLRPRAPETGRPAKRVNSRGGRGASKSAAISI